MLHLVCKLLVSVFCFRVVSEVFSQFYIIATRRDSEEDESRKTVVDPATFGSSRLTSS